MTTYYGKGVFDAIAIGKAFLFQHQDRPVRKYCVDNVPQELERFEAAKELAADPSLTETFLRMGIDELSVSPPFVLPLRDAVRKLDLSK